MQKERALPIAIRPKPPNQFILAQSTDAVQQLSPSGNAYGTSQPIAITGSPNPKQKGVQFAQPGFSLNTARLNLENAAAHSAPNNTVNYGSLDSRRYTKIGHKVPLQSIPQQSQISPSLPPSLFNNIQLAGSYQSSEDNDSLFADSDCMEDGGNATATPEVDDDEDTLDRINPTIDLSQYPQFQLIEIGDGSGQIISSPNFNNSSNSTIPFSTSCPENLARNRAELAEISPGPVAEKDKDRIKKDNHNKVERRRRYHINDRIQELGLLLPRKEEMKINKGNILKSACEYVREARQLEEEYKLMGSKLQDFDKVAQCLLSRINELECNCQRAGVSYPKPSSDQEISMQAVASGRLFGGLSVINNGQLLNSLSNNQPQTASSTPPLPISPRSNSSNAFEKSASQGPYLSPLVAAKSPSMSRIPTVTGPRGTTDQAASDTNSELVNLLSTQTSNGPSLLPSYFHPQSSSQSTHCFNQSDHKLRNVPSIVMTPSRQHSSHVPVRAVVPQNMRISTGSHSVRISGNHSNVKSEPLTPAPATSEFCQGQERQHSEAGKSSVSPENSRNQQRAPFKHSTGRAMTKSCPDQLPSPLVDVKPTNLGVSNCLSEELSAEEINLCNVVMDLDFSPDVPSAPLAFDPNEIVQTASNNGSQSFMDLHEGRNYRNNCLPDVSQNSLGCNPNVPISSAMDDQQFDFDMSMAANY
ncbi:uncharacterized protein LOC134845584 isoform X3 [Symsagittifera roscoffensis]|uniref:uncharacterized protein LOC134845584 isoform X3 n=1 Tax=Symsagittifera roscoffensis TaxID=84072 RepID=UPI00307CA1A4